MTNGSLDPDTLDKLRRGVPLVLSATGRFRFEGEDVTHPRVNEALRAGLDRTASGELCVHLGEQWCYLQVDDLPLRVLAVTPAGDGLELTLDDGRTVPLDPETLREQPERGLRAEVPSQRSGRSLGARLTNVAAMQLSEWITLDAEDQAWLTLNGQRFAIANSCT